MHALILSADLAMFVSLMHHRKVMPVSAKRIIVLLGKFVMMMITVPNSLFRLGSNIPFLYF